ncbi:MAG: hypothetical protein JXA72_12815 [Bacteroidales bacterium]|nr:hypothetical protein [Bacteroidales bacterium]
MKGKFFIPTILLLIVFACDEKEISDIQAEQFVKFYKNYSEFSAADVTETSTGYAFVGTSKLDDETTRICLIRTDEYGNSIDSAKYFYRVVADQIYNDRAFCLKTTSDGGFAILGSSRNPVTDKQDVIVIRTDQKGNRIWSHVFSSTGILEARHFEIDDGGSFIITGYAQESDNIKRIWLAALDNSGNEPWEPKLLSKLAPRDAVGQYVQILSDGFVITGTSKNNPSYPGIPNVFVLKTTDQGAVNDQYYLSSNTDEEGNCIRVLDDDHFLVLSTVKTATGTDIALNAVSFTSFPHSVDWRKTYINNGKNVGCSVFKAGNSIYVLGTTATTASNSAICLIAADASGNQKSHSDFGIASELTAMSFRPVSNGGFIILGTNHHSDRNTAVALIKVGPEASF